jgi:hypothetical protein
MSSWSTSLCVTEALFSADAPATTQQGWLLLLIPLVVLLTAILIAVLVARHSSLQIDRWFRRRGKRLASTIVLGLATIVSLLIELPGMSDIKDGKIDGGDAFWLSMAAILFVAVIFVEWSSRASEDQVEQELAKEQERTSQLEADLAAERKSVADKEAEWGKQNADKEFILQVNKAFVNVLAKRRQSVVRVKGRVCRVDSPEPLAPNLLREAMNPKAHMTRLFTCVFEIYRFRLDQIDPQADLRWAYFRMRANGRLEVVHSFNGERVQCVKSPWKMWKRFIVDVASYVPDPSAGEQANGEIGASLAAWAARTGEIGISENCDLDDVNHGHPYWHYTPNQKRAIKSMIAMPLGDPDDKGRHSHVLCLDTNLRNFFTHEHVDRFRQVRYNLERRLMFELDLNDLLSANGGA